MIASLARDVLSIPAIGTRVERLFNTTRDICYYRYGRLKSDTIKEIILFLYITRFNLREDEARQLEQFFTIYKIKVAREEKNESSEDLEIDVISNTKE